MPQPLGRDRRARRQARAQEFGRRHPRLTVGTVCVLLAGAVAVCAFQLGHGTYLGRTWLIAAAAGIATAIVLGAAAAISNRRRGPALGRLEWAWTILAVLSASSLRLPFPVGPYDGVQAFFNVAHATLLGYAVVSYTALTALLAYVLIRPRGLPGRLALRRPAPRSADAAEPPPDRSRQLSLRRAARAHSWSAWALAGAVAGLVAAVILAGVGGSDPHDAANTASGWVGLSGLVALCVAGPAALHRWYRSRRGRRNPAATTASRPSADAGRPDWP